MKYILIEFPEIQEYMELEDFEEHSSLADWRNLDLLLIL